MEKQGLPGKPETGYHKGGVMVDREHLPEAESRPDWLRKAETDAIRIWKTGVDAVRPEKLIPGYIRFEGKTLVIGTPGSPGLRFDGRQIGRVLVVGAGKAGASMAAAVEDRFLHHGTETGPDEEAAIAEFWKTKFIGGWVNVPENCVRPLERITLCGARPPMANEPTETGVLGTQRILRLLAELTPDDLCLCLISGGGSALMPAPVDGVSLDDLIGLTRFLSDGGANIAEINTVRCQLSRVKGGRLARACAAPIVSLILSDIPGDPLDLVASGPTVPGTGTAEDALAILRKYQADTPECGICPDIFRILESMAVKERPMETTNGGSEDGVSGDGGKATDPSRFHVVIGNNATAVSASAWEAYRTGYEVVEANAATAPEGLVEEVARALVDQIVAHLGLAGMD
ncbi:MAG: glycerate-2-kinase family protein, partial [Planctomycetia bacterium]|nr:glycerate-2-kinase family protein [Planctomycetia bacterium]